MGDSSLSDVERPKLGNDIFQHPLRPQMLGTDPQDGMPRVTSPLTMQDTLAPKLDPESFVCMGDESMFVLRDSWGDVRIEFRPDEVRRDREGEFFVSRGALDVAQLNMVGQVERELINLGYGAGSDSPWIKVEPLRHQCHYYRRVMTDFENDLDHRSVERVCAAQRTEGGEYIALGNTRVYACEHRVPRDFVSEERLRKFDADRIAEGKKTEEEWDADAALAEATKDLGEST